MFKHLHFCQNDRDLPRVAMAPAAERPDAVIGSAQKVDPAKENSPAVPPGNRTHDLSITRPAHYH